MQKCPTARCWNLRELGNGEIFEIESEGKTALVLIVFEAEKEDGSGSFSAIGIGSEKQRINGVRVQARWREQG